MTAQDPSDAKEVSAPFRPKARLLLLLGDQLIKSPGIAAFELAKNAYDADATRFDLTMTGIEDRNTGIIIAQDNGSGMTWETVTGIWLEPGSGHREEQRLANRRSPRFNRLPMGEKGVGRFAAHKLGSTIELVSRAEGSPEVVLHLNWDEFASSRKYLDEILVHVETRAPKLFTGEKTGTRITISGLREDWTRGMVRDLARAVNSIYSPFGKRTDTFKPAVHLPDNSDWVAGLLKAEDVKDEALFEVHGTIEGREFRYTYSFNPLPGMRLAPRTIERTVTLNWPSAGRGLPQPESRLDLTGLDIGPVQVDLFIYDLDSAVLALVSDKKGLREYLAQNGGVRVYRDDVRVFDYAEPGDDWLDLEGRRINRPGQRLSNNLILGAVTLDREESRGLVEQTNREGFVANRAFDAFVAAIQSAVVHVEGDRTADKARLRATSPGLARPEPVLADIAEIRAVADSKGFLRDIRSMLDRIERDYTSVRDVLLVSANAGLSLTVVIHEVEKGLTELRYAVDADSGASQRVKAIAERLSRLIEGLGAIAKRSGMTKERATTLMEQAAFNAELRVAAHDIDLSLPPLGDFVTKCSRRLIVATLMNLVDNSIWWLDHEPPDDKQILMFASRDLAAGNAIIVADNNTLGFIDPADVLTQPFHTRKPGGMGLGLHIASEVMKANNGRFEVIDAGDAGLPRTFKAVVALIFPEAEWLG